MKKFSARRFLAISAAAMMVATLSGCTFRARGGRQHAPPPPPPATMSAPVQPHAAQPPPPIVQPGRRARQPQLLGSRQVTFRAEKDTIVAAHQGTFRRLQLRVSGSPLEMYNVRVTFGDGSRFSPNTRLVFTQGAWSRVLDLPGRARRIRKIEFWYRSRGVRSGRANIQVFGV